MGRLRSNSPLNANGSDGVASRGSSSVIAYGLCGAIIPARDQIEGLGMRRRNFLTVLAGAIGGLPTALRAQQKAMPVIGYLSASNAPSSLNEPFWPRSVRA